MTTLFLVFFLGQTFIKKIDDDDIFTISTNMFEMHARSMFVLLESGKTRLDICTRIYSDIADLNSVRGLIWKHVSSHQFFGIENVENLENENELS